MEDNSEHQPKKYNSIHSQDLPQPILDAPKPSLFNERGGITRKGFLWGMGASLLGMLGLTAIMQDPPKEGKGPASISTPKPPTATPEKPVSLETLSDHELLNRALSLPLADQERKKAELIYFERAKTVEQINKGLWVINYFGGLSDNHRELRAKLLNKRFDLRQNGSIKEAPKIPQEMINWAIEQKIHPEVLALCLENEEWGMNIIQKLINKSVKETGSIGQFRPDFVDPARSKDLPPDLRKAIQENKVAADTLMINAAGMAKLICTETGLEFPMVVGKDEKGNDIRKIVSYGFTNTGDKKVTEQVGGNQAALNALSELFQKLQKDTGLNFSAANIPGSSMGEGDAAGGAIGPQFMPGTALEMYKLFENVGEKFNPFDPACAIVAAWVFLARSQHLSNRPGKDYREGYIKGRAPITLEYREYALGKWNQNQKQIDSVLGAAIDFANKFLGPLIYDKAYPTLSKN